MLSWGVGISLSCFVWSAVAFPPLNQGVEREAGGGELSGGECVPVGNRFSQLGCNADGEAVCGRLSERLCVPRLPLLATCECGTLLTVQETSPCWASV